MSEVTAMSDMNKRIDSILTNLRPHSPNWVDRLRKYINYWLKRAGQLERELNQQSTLLAEAREVIRFYADIENYINDATSKHPYKIILGDHGQRARNLLAKMEGQ